jgi:putative ABC transport system ATP-binding protein
MIKASNLSYQYNGGRNIDFPEIALERGGHMLILGNSGSGKTTLLHLFGGLLRIQRGNIVVGQTDISQLSETQLDHFRGKQIGFVFQKNHLINALTPKQNLLLSSYLAEVTQDEKRVESLLDQLGLGDKMNARISELSQGQIQRVAIARAVLNKPTFILADEPTSALDDKNCEKVIDLLFNLAKENNASLLIATHDLRLKSKIRDQVTLNNSLGIS